ncbi:related to sterigmatocystin 8-O-methyltransferase precursor [Ramularia collo-cygni]|uniref:Related to sterigmatocystin 8-O-methyltransferase n=1 Tax=Ramularia collo-cygni TaxID=112498 RepID=A0A2D3US48_9PEZI|nr:related to sterigmatocystin 8-O-methyltransferase precursor [Ramularia collo-cygni]CZT16505.1 related to sterigmatocystin 8-O-methyltransferase precursor [Ramularia collo-cygni]
MSTEAPASHSSELVELSNAISKHSAIIDSYNLKHGIPSATFEPADTGAEVDYPKDIAHSKDTVLDATAKLNDLLTGPRGLVSNAGFPSLIKFATLRFIYRFRLVEKVPQGGEISYAELAAQTGLRAATLRQLLRAAMTYHMFAEKREGYVSHSSVTQLLLTDTVLHDCAGFTTEDMIPGFLGVVDALLEHPAADDPSKSGYMVAHGVSEPSFYLHLAKDPEKIRRFTHCMSQAIAGPPWSMDHLTDNFPWADYGSGTVVDVGGSTGQAAFAIAKKFPNLKLIVQDMGDANSAHENADGANVSHMVHDFFSEQSVTNADVYLFRSVLHNWPDAQAIDILRAQRAALKDGARILIMDELMPAMGEMTLTQERTQRLMDLAQLALGNSKIRDEQGWRELCKAADHRFVVENVIRPVNSHLALIEVSWQS